LNGYRLLRNVIFVVVCPWSDDVAPVFVPVVAAVAAEHERMRNIKQMLRQNNSLLFLLIFCCIINSPANNIFVTSSPFK